MDTEQLSIFRGCTPVINATYDSDCHRSLAVIITEALAEAAGVSPMDLPPLYKFIDPDALDRLFNEHNKNADTDALLSFKVETWNVFVSADGRICICDAKQPTNPQPIFEPNSA